MISDEHSDVGLFHPGYVGSKSGILEPERMSELRHRLSELPEEVANVLLDIALAGGTLRGFDGAFDLAAQAGLVEITVDGGGWGFSETATFTRKACYLLGFGPPKIRKSAISQVADWIIARWRH